MTALCRTNPQQWKQRCRSQRWQHASSACTRQQRSGTGTLQRNPITISVRPSDASGFLRLGYTGQGYASLPLATDQRVGGCDKARPAGLEQRDQLLQLVARDLCRRNGPGLCIGGPSRSWLDRCAFGSKDRCISNTPPLPAQLLGRWRPMEQLNL